MRRVGLILTGGSIVNQIFVNLKRFEVSRKSGGVCDMTSPKEWIEKVLEECVKLELGRLPDTRIAIFLPEALIITAIDKLGEFPAERTKNLSIGCQGVYREDITTGGNFGAFTTSFPATAAKVIGCDWAIIGHSEERKNIQGIIGHYTAKGQSAGQEASANAVNGLINKAVLCALHAGLNVLYCVGETAEEKGTGTIEEQQERIKSVLHKQLAIGLKGIGQVPAERLVIGYEPIWAIGPGKTPPDAAYIDFTAAVIKEEMKKLYGLATAVVYGGGLKEENARKIAQIKNIDGGLVALTRFTGEIGFYPEDLKKIVDAYLKTGKDGLQ